MRRGPTAWQRLWRRDSLLACGCVLLLALLATGCIGTGGGGGGRALRGRPSDARANQPPATASEAPLLREAPTRPLTSDDLFEVYAAILQNYVEPVEPQVLIEGAIQGFARGVELEGLYPLDVDLVEGANIRYTADPQRDWAQFETRFDNFVGKIGPRLGIGAVGQATLRGMLGALRDPDTTYVERAAGQAGQSRSYVGIGVVLATADQVPIIREVIEGGPAARAGLRAGDRILAVDGASTPQAAPEETIQRIRGAEGTSVALTVATLGSVRDVRVTRAPVTLIPVSTSIGQSLGYVKIRTFQDGVPEAVYDALTQLNEAGAVAWILDLRGNRGGDLEEAVRTASLFVGDRVIGLQVDRTQRQAAIRSSGQPTLTVLPTAVLVDDETAAGAELLAASLRDYGLAVVVGKTTAGNASVASAQQLPDGSTVRITTRRVLTPSGEQIHGIGVKADLEAETTPDDWARGRDPQFDRAVRHLLVSS